MGELAVAIMGGKNYKGGAYDVLSSFHHGLLNGFLQNDVKTYYLKDCYENNIPFNIVISFNSSGLPLWQKIMDGGIYHVMWSVDSIFGQNYNLIKHYANHPKFALFEVAPADFKASRHFMPNLKHAPICHATNPDFWQKKDVKKEFDITFFSSIKDYEQLKNDAMAQMSDVEKKVFLDLYDLCMNNPDHSYHDVFATYQQHVGMTIDEDTYIRMYNNVVYINEHEQKVKLIQSLKDFNVKIFGNDLWKKYISPNQEYMGAKNIDETVDLMNKSKITIHPHPMSLYMGLHERFLNASAVGTFVLTSNTANLKNIFSDNYGYYNDIKYDDVADVASYFLKENDLRDEKANNAREIVLKDHTWKNRAQQIMTHLEL